MRLVQSAYVVIGVVLVQALLTTYNRMESIGRGLSKGWNMTTQVTALAAANGEPFKILATAANDKSINDDDDDNTPTTTDTDDGIPTPGGTGTREKGYTPEKKKRAVAPKPQTSRGPPVTAKDCSETCHSLFATAMGFATTGHSTGVATSYWNGCQCDNLFCKKPFKPQPSSQSSGVVGDSLSYCQWSPASIDALVTLLNSTSDICTEQQQEEFFPDEEWERYNFGDFMKRKAIWDAARLWDQNPKKPGSLMEAFYIYAKAHIDTTDRQAFANHKGRFLNHVVQERIKNLTKSTVPQDQWKPKPRTLIIHLRLGDVIDSACHPVQELLKEQKYYWRFNTTKTIAPPWLYPNRKPFVAPWNQYVRPLSYYTNILQQQAAQSKRRYTSVVILGAAHKGQDLPAEFHSSYGSCIYTRFLKAYIEKVWPHAKVSFRLGQNPDHDIVFSAQAAGFIQGGGGYSAVLNGLQHTFQANRQKQRQQQQKKSGSHKVTLTVDQQKECNKKCHKLFAVAIGLRDATTSMVKEWNGCQCDEQFCLEPLPGLPESHDEESVGDTLTYCDWTDAAIDSLVQHLNQSSAICTPEQTAAFYPEEEWESYKFGDFYKRIGDWDWEEKWDHNPKKPGSLMMAFYNRAKANYDTSTQAAYASNRQQILYEVVKERIQQLAASNVPEEEWKPNESTLTIHLRVGDVIDSAVDPVSVLLKEKKYFWRMNTSTSTTVSEPWLHPDRDPFVAGWNQYVKPLISYTGVIRKQYARRPQQFGTIVLLTTAHNAQDLPDKYKNAYGSCLYSNAIKYHIQKVWPGMNVVLRSGKPPDTDLAFTAQSWGFLQGGGGYSVVLQDLHDKFKQAAKQQQQRRQQQVSTEVEPQQQEEQPKPEQQELEGQSQPEQEEEPQQPPEQQKEEDPASQDLVKNDWEKVGPACQQRSEKCFALFATSLGFYIPKMSSERNYWKECNCNGLYCKQPLKLRPRSTDGKVPPTLSYCKWSNLAIETLIQLLGQSNNVCTPSQVEAFHPEEEWDLYNFADFYKRVESWDADGPWDSNPKKSGSVMEAFYNYAKGHINTGDRDSYEANKEQMLTHVVKERIHNLTFSTSVKSSWRPKPGTLVIHLRLGDVIDSAVDPVADLLKEQKFYWRFNTSMSLAEPWLHPEKPPYEATWNAYVRPLSYYQEVLQAQALRQQHFRRIVIMGAAHKGQNLPEEYRASKASCLYANALKVYVRKVWPDVKVSLRMGQAPDDDMVFAAQADGFVPGGGGYSSVLGHLQESIGERRNRECSGKCEGFFAGALGFNSSISIKGADSVDSWRECRCDNLYCKEPPEHMPLSDDGAAGDSLSYCEWSGLAVDTLVQLLNETSNVCDRQQTDAFYPGEEWERYNFADFFKRKKNWDWTTGRWDNNPKKPGSLMESFYNYAKTNFDTSNDGVFAKHVYKILNKIIDERITNFTISKTPEALWKPAPDTFVIHLRLGDVVDGARDSVQELLKDQKYFWRYNTSTTFVAPWEYPNRPPYERPWNQYVRPLSFYNDVLLRRASQQHRYKSIVLLGAAHKGQDLPAEFKNVKASCLYTNALKVYIEKVWPDSKVTLRLGQPPDNDMVYTAQAEGFLQGGGGYSKILAKLHARFMREKRQSMAERCTDMFATALGIDNTQSASNLASDWIEFGCDDVYCLNHQEIQFNETVAGDALSYCEWSDIAIDALVQSLNASSDICTPEQTAAFYPAEEWDRYNLADFIKRKKNWDWEDNSWDSNPKVPGSIMEAYYDYSKAHYNTSNETEFAPFKYDILYHIVEERIENLTLSKAVKDEWKPKPRTLVMHLRLGDVIDVASDSVQDLLKDQKYFWRQNTSSTYVSPREYPDLPPFKRAWNQYVRPLSYYSGVLKRQAKQLDRFASVVLMGSAHLGQDLPTDSKNATGSCLYANTLKFYIQKVWPGITVDLRLGNSPDNDLAYASQAAGFLKGGGGYSFLLQKLHERAIATKGKRLAELKAKARTRMLGPEGLANGESEGTSRDDGTRKPPGKRGPKKLSSEEFSGAQGAASQGTFGSLRGMLPAALGGH